MKHHFANSSEPLKEGAELVAMCGQKIPKASFKAMQDAGWRPYIGYGVNCQKCNGLTPRLRFLYVICAGQEARDAEEL